MFIAVAKTLTYNILMNLYFPSGLAQMYGKVAYADNVVCLY